MKLSSMVAHLSQDFHSRYVQPRETTIVSSIEDSTSTCFCKRDVSNRLRTGRVIDNMQLVVLNTIRKNLNNSLLKNTRSYDVRSARTSLHSTVRDVRACKPLFRVQAVSLRNIRACRPRFHVYTVHCSIPQGNTCILF